MARAGEFLPVEHGSDHKNAQRCDRRPEGICTPCRVVRAAHLRERRRSSAAVRANQRIYNRARMRAWARLQRLHPEQFAGLLDQELRRERGATGAVAS